MARRLFVFDLDDTLIDNVHDYAFPILDSARLIIEVLGAKAPHVSKIISLEQRIDTERVACINPETGKPFGYSMQRFPGTMVEVYREICQKSGTVPDSVIEKKLWKIGMGAFDTKRYEKNIKPDVIETLQFIHASNDLTMLVTKGDLSVQNYKILALSRADIHFSEGVRIVDNKSTDMFAEIARMYAGFKKYSVGNDYDKDIVPALNTGYFYGLWIPVETWETIDKMDEIRGRVDRSKCSEILSISEVKNAYGEVI